MDAEPVTGTTSGASGRWTILAALGIVVAAVAVWGIVVEGWPGGRGTVEVVAIRNARPGVKYVGDAACARCHKEITQTYRQHPMGRSLAPIDAPGAATGDGKVGDVFESDGFHYGIERRDGKVFHRETLRDGDGKAVTEVEGEARFVLGSGSHAISFVIDRDGYLFESPLTWYSQAEKWDLSPGFGELNGRFERQIRPGCLYCHANRFQPVSGSVNHYESPIFLGHAIGCERCHGPGELHARRPFESAADGPNIVNPGDLSHALRDDVCQQCHITGAARIERFGREATEYRPGLPLRQFETIFVRPPGTMQELRNAGHVEQMHQSRCFKASNGALGCISCHNPHEKPPEETKDAYFRDRCLDCHATQGCTLPEPDRHKTTPPDSCITCHMPRTATSNIPHVATTIHRIPRFREDGAPEAPDRQSGPTDDLLLVPFPKAPEDAAERREIARDLAVALETRPEPIAVQIRPILEEALIRHPDDHAAREALGFVLGTLGKGDEGLAAFDRVLAASPKRESTLWAAGALAGVMDRPEASIDYWRRLHAINPWLSTSHASLGHQLLALDRLKEAISPLRRALALNPDSIPARTDLITCLVRLGSADEARAEFEILLKLRPSEGITLRRWFHALGN